LSEAVTWIGCFEVLLTERAEKFGADGIYGAFVNVVVHADSKVRFRELAAEALDQEGYQILDIQDAERVDLSDSGLPEDELELIVETLSQNSPVAFGYFHSYPKEGLDA
jgi:hypothetical protein